MEKLTDREDWFWGDAALEKLLGENAVACPCCQHPSSVVEKRMYELFTYSQAGEMWGNYLGSLLLSPGQTSARPRPITVYRVQMVAAHPLQDEGLLPPATGSGSRVDQRCEFLPGEWF